MIASNRSYPILFRSGLCLSHAVIRLKNIGAVLGCLHQSFHESPCGLRALPRTPPRGLLPRFYGPLARRLGSPDQESRQRALLRSGDPVRTGLAASLSRPGGNITGLTNIIADLGGKLIELVLELRPPVSRVSVLTIEGNPLSEPFEGNCPCARLLGQRFDRVTGSHAFDGDEVRKVVPRLVPQKFRAPCCRGVWQVRRDRRRRLHPPSSNLGTQEGEL